MSMNYYANNPLNRLSYLRSSAAFLSSALSDPKARFILYNSLNPLCSPPSRSDGSIKLHTLSWEDVKQYVEGGIAEDVFKCVDGKNPEALGEVGETFWLADTAAAGGKTEGTAGVRRTLTSEEKKNHFINQAPLVFLGVDERSAPSSTKSLPLSKPDENSTLSSHSPYGTPYWALDVTNTPELRARFEKKGDGFEFVDMRAGMASIPGEEAAVGGEGRALVDWNKRNLFCPACSRPTRSVWAGWKRACIPGEPSGPGLATPPVCISKKGVHNFSYPRTDPVVIMAVLSPDRESVLLGRQKAWPKKFYSCLAGFIESGETLEEAVRREVYEEAGVEVGEVFYHSSQPWPYPSSLMMGCIAIAKPNQTIRCDLDNELEEATYFTRAQVLSVINGGGRMALTREEVSRIDGKEGASAAIKEVGQGSGIFRMPPVTAIANTLIQAWATNSYLDDRGPGAGAAVASNVAGGAGKL